MVTPPRPRTTIRVRTSSAAQTRAFGAWLAAVAEAGDRIELLGTLGAGKTQLAKGFAAGLGVRDTVTSPSFTLMAEYEGRLPLFHQDLYRLAGAGEAFEGGLLDERQDLGVTLTEWADRLGPDAAPEHLGIRLRATEDKPALAADAESAGYDASALADDATPFDDPAAGPTDEVRWLELEAPPRYVRYLDRARAWEAGA
ncbi:MAG: tRNA (adenosine(37)-N6)-threonylcarbamoyltransferase complex ATPase subunit type 1 TsaE [Chloroflexi bacterium]|nr:tRNA (adenosine(37)-N6)-threonylcarbamoyltransferase complex ATPase subunit type 1 TsaE [Chloroflexota bacterium]